MKNLDDIIQGYRELFHRTGKIEFFMRAKNVEKLQRNITLIEAIQEEDSLTL